MSLRPVRVVAACSVVAASVLFFSERGAEEVAANDAAVRAALVELRMRSADLDLVAFQTLVLTRPNYDALTAASQDLQRFHADLGKAEGEGVEKARSSYALKLVQRVSDIEKLKSARGRLINIEHYLPVYIEENAGDGDFLKVRSALLAYVLDPSTVRFDELTSLQDKVVGHPKLHQYLTTFVGARDELGKVRSSLIDVDLARAADEVVAAQDLVIAQHKSEAQLRRSIGLLLLLLLAVAGLWAPLRGR